MRPGVRVIGIDDGPFERSHRGDVRVVGAIYQGGTRLEGILSSKVRRDGRNATDRLVQMIGASRFAPQLHYVMLDGIALAGFNVIDLPRLSAELELPALVVCRTAPDLEAVHDALQNHVPGGAAKWKLVQRAGPVLPIEGLHCQLAGLGRDEAAALIRLTRRNGKLPEPIRTAHLVATGIETGASHGRA